MFQESTFSFQVFFAMHAHLTLRADLALHTYFALRALKSQSLSYRAKNHDCMSVYERLGSAMGPF